MADITQKQYVDYAGLSYYDGLLKTYIDSAKTKSVKTVLWDATDEKIRFYKKADATKADTADLVAEVSISSATVTALNTRVGIDKTLNAYQSKDNLTEIVNVLTSADSVDGSIAKLIKSAIEALDGSATIATVADGVVTIKGGVKEVDGILSQDADKSDITLAKVATTGKAEDVSVAAKSQAATDDHAAYELAAGTAQATAEGFAQDIADLDAAVKAAKVAGKVTLTKAATADEGYAATYVFAQGGEALDTTDGKLTKINIPKDFLVKSGELKTVTEAGKPYADAKVGDKYIDFVINVKEGSATDEHMYIPVNDLFDSYTSGSATGDMVVVTVDNDTNKISAAITDGTVTRAKIATAFENDIAALEGTHAKNGDAFKSVSTQIDEEAKDATYAAATETTAKVTIKQKIDAVEAKITSEIEGLDATKTQSANAGATYADNTGLNLKVVETDGKITEISGSIDTISNSQIDGLFPA